MRWRERRSFRRKLRLEHGHPVGPDRWLAWLWCLAVRHRWTKLYTLRNRTYQWLEFDEPIVTPRPTIEVCGMACQRCGKRVRP